MLLDSLQFSIDLVSTVVDYCLIGIYMIVSDLSGIHYAYLFERAVLFKVDDSPQNVGEGMCL
jgi:hypothetical protein